tara:strand:- start:324 stop:698 length:375 start_codon:yes stop_codon:yes gene_type:complete
MSERNINTIRQMIERKNEWKPYSTSGTSVTPIINDYDHHPYSRWYRGVYYYPEPVIAEREAGWREQEQQCYSLNLPLKDEKEPQHCFSAPCSTVYPCYPEYLQKESDKQAMDTLLNNTCIVQYR